MPKAKSSTTHRKKRNSYTKTDKTKRESTTKPDPIFKNGHHLFEVEKLIETRLGSHGEEFLVKWKGYPHSDNTWIDTIPDFFNKSSPHFQKKRYPISFTQKMKLEEDLDYNPVEPVSESDEESDDDSGDESEMHEEMEDDDDILDESMEDDDDEPDEGCDVDANNSTPSFKRAGHVTKNSDSIGDEIDKVGDKVDALWPEKTQDGLNHFYPCEIKSFRGKNSGVEVLVQWDGPDTFTATSWISLKNVRDRNKLRTSFAPITGTIRKNSFDTQAERDAYDALSDYPKRLSNGPCPGCSKGVPNLKKRHESMK